jgi:putative DNA primase/helicase
MSKDPIRLAVDNAPSEPWLAAEVPHGWRLDRRGLNWLKKNRGGEDIEEVPIAGPVWVIALTRDPRGQGWGHVVQWLDLDGQVHERAIARSRLHEQGPALAQELAGDGLFIVPGQERRLSAYLAHSRPRTRFRSMDVLGWADDAHGRPAYVLPDRVLASGVPAERERIVFQPERHSPTVHSMRPRGSLSEWQRQVAEPCQGNPFLVFALCVGFSGPLLRLSRLSDGGFHVFGPSSRGKTTLAQVAASLWGCGADPAEAPSAAYAQRWNTTRNALEGLAAAHNDGVLILDELGTCSAKDFGQVIYDLAGGQGKGAMDRDRQLRPRRRWRVMVLSTGEVSSSAKVQEQGRALRGGHLVRLLDIPAEGRIIVDAHSETPGSFARRLKDACATVYGTAGPAFVEYLLARFPDAAALEEHLKRRLAQISDARSAPDRSPEAQRGLQKFAVVHVAGELAVSAELLPFGMDAVDTSMTAVRELWLQDEALVPDAVRGVEAVRSYILRHEARFQDVDSREAVRDRAGFRDRMQGLYLLTSEAFNEACGSHEPRAVLQALHERGWLLRSDAQRYVSRHTVHTSQGKSRVKLYAVRVQLLDEESAS